MKLLSIFICFVISTQTIASTIPLKNLVDRYHYTLAVEWDQKDEQFKTQAADAFISELNQLVISKQIQHEDVVEAMAELSPSKEGIELIKLKLAFVPQEQLAQELVSVINENPELFYKKGAHWLGSIDWGMTAIIVLSVAIVAYAVWWGIKYDCVEYDYQRRNDCNSSNCYRQVCVKWVEAN